MIPCANLKDRARVHRIIKRTCLAAEKNDWKVIIIIHGELAAESKCREHICDFTSDCTYYTEFHEILQSECNSHANFLIITHEWSNIIMECRLILKSLVSKFSNISNRVNVPRFSCVSAQLKSLLQPSDRRRARHHFRGHFYQSSDPFKPGVNIQFRLHVFSNKFLNFLLQPLLRRGILFLISWLLLILKSTCQLFKVESLFLLSFCSIWTKSIYNLALFHDTLSNRSCG